MGSIISPKKPKTPEPPPPPEPLPPPPERSDEETKSLAEEQKRKLVSRNGRGRASTFLTSGGLDQGASAVRFLGSSKR